MPSVIGSYRVEGVIGQGGMGVVYRATQISLDRPVALKVIAPQYAADPTFRERFRREWQLAATLEHPNVVAVYELGEDQGIPYSAMRLVNGPDLRRVIEDTGPLAPERAVAIVEQIAGAIDAAHARDLVHRDIKPANILLEHTGRSETAYLTDFGVVKRLGDDQNLTGAEGWVGSLNYVTPEQVRGETVTPAADVYGLGAVLFTMLTGAVPFQRADSAATLYATVNDPTPLDGLPPHLAPVVDRAMAKDPTRRYPSAGNLADAARSALGRMAPMPPDRTAPDRIVPDATVPDSTALGPITPGLAPRRSQRRWSRARRRSAGVAAAATGAAATVAALALAGVLVFGGGSQPTPKAASSTSPATTSATSTSATSAASTSATTTRPVRIAPATTEPASTAPATTAPAPPASTSLGAATRTGTGPVTFDYNDNVSPGTMTLAVTGVVRQGPFARVDLTVRCDTPGGCDTAALEYPSGLTPLEAVELVDPVHEQFHLPVEDNDHHLAVSSLPFSDLAYHHRYDAWSPSRPHR